MGVAPAHAQAVLDFWFGRGDTARAEWFRKDPAFDAHIATRFGALVERLSACQVRSRAPRSSKSILGKWPRRANNRRPSGIQEHTMSLRINDIAPNFAAKTTHGTIDFHQWIGDSWAVLFSHPKDFTPVCTTELGTMAKLEPEFRRRNTKVIGLSVDPVEDHDRWSKDIEETQGALPNYPLGSTERVARRQRTNQNRGK